MLLHDYQSPPCRNVVPHTHTHTDADTAIIMVATATLTTDAVMCGTAAGT